MFERAQNGELARIEVPVTSIRITDTPINRSRTGYGKKLPTRYMVRTIDQKWRRVYCVCYSNSGTLYVRHGDKLTIVELLGV